MIYLYFILGYISIVGIIIYLLFYFDNTDKCECGEKVDYFSEIENYEIRDYSICGSCGIKKLLNVEPTTLISN